MPGLHHDKHATVRDSNSTRVGRSIYLEFANHVPTIIVLAVFYVSVNLILTAIATWVQKKFVGEKKPLTVPMVGGAGPGAAV